MTNNQLTDDRIAALLDCVEMCEDMSVDENAEMATALRELQERRKATMDSEPAGEVVEVGGALLVEWHKNLEEGAKLYTTPQAPIMPFGLHPDTQKLVTDFCAALAEKLYKAQLKYGYDADWKHDGWPSQCQAHFHQHIAKGDPRDVAAYCAFMWYHGWKTEAAQPAPVVPTFDEWLEIRGSKPLGWVKDAMRESYDACRAAMLAASQHDTPALNSLQSVVTVPGKWIPISERVPDVGVKVLCFPVKDEPIHATFNGQLWLQDVSWSGSDDPIDNVIPVSVTHWMPLPAAPQEVQGE